MYEIHLTQTIDTGHRIVGHKGKCARLHGHTYRYEITLASPVLSGEGFVLDYGDVKAMLDEWDHRLILWDEDPIAQDILGFADGPGDLETIGIVQVPFNPTAELIAQYWAERFKATLRAMHGGFALNTVAEVEVWETPKSRARWVA